MSVTLMKRSQRGEGVLNLQRRYLVVFILYISSFGIANLFYCDEKLFHCFLELFYIVFSLSI